MSGTIYVPQAAVSIAGGIQPAILERSIGTQHRENGLLARMLLAYPPRRAKCWNEAELDPFVEARLVGVFDRLYELEPNVDSDENLAPRVLDLRAEAKRVWARFVNEHGAEQAALVGDEAAGWSKLESYASRLGLVIHLVRVAASDASVADPDTVDETSIAAGIRLSRWFGAEALRIYALFSQDEQERDRHRHAESIALCGGEISVREWQRRGSRKGAKQARAELENLVRAGLGTWKRVPSGRKGSPSQVFVLHGASAATDRTSIATEATRLGCP